MRRSSRWFIVLVVVFVAVVPAVFPAGMGERSIQPAKLRHDPRFILEMVAREMNVVLRSEIPVPAIFVESATPLRRFQDAIAVQWGFRPRLFANAYAVASNEIYLIDDSSYYARLKRTPDDSLAHEFAHYLQVHYFNADLADLSCELEAIAIQTWFREAHAAAQAAAAAESAIAVTFRNSAR